MARPCKRIDSEQVCKLAALGLTADHIAAVLGCERTTLFRRFAIALKKGHELRNASLTEKQFKVAMKGNTALLIWLGKQYLGQSDKQQISGPDGGPIELRELSDEELEAQIQKLMKDLGLVEQIDAAPRPDDFPLLEAFPGDSFDIDKAWRPLRPPFDCRRCHHWLSAGLPKLNLM